MSNLQALLREISKVDGEISRWKQDYATELEYVPFAVTSDKTSSWLQRSEGERDYLFQRFNEMTIRKGGLIREIIKHCANPEIADTIGYEFYFHIHNEIRFNTPRFRGCLGITELTVLWKVPQYHHRVAMNITNHAGWSNGDFSTRASHYMREIRLMWSTVHQYDGIRIEWDYDIQSNTLFIRER